MLRDSDLVSVQEVRSKVERAYAAFQTYRNFSQEQIDSIVEAMGAAARANARRLAEMAVTETSYGNAKDKLAKNLLCADLMVRTIRGMKTVGVLREVPERKIIEIGVPVGVVAAILPTTNPTSTAIYKTIISLKSGNPVVISPHPRAKDCTCATAAILTEAAVKAGAPEDAIQCVHNATMEGTEALMRHPRTSVILATGGAGIVKAAYSSGKPAYGVGPGNVPVLLEKTADLGEAIPKIVEGKSFDYGTVCSSEQSIVGLVEQRDAVLTALRGNGAHLCTTEQSKALAKLLIAPNWRIDPRCVGQAPEKIAAMAGFEVPAGTRILVAEIGGVGKEHPLSMEKLSPVLSALFVNSWEEQVRSCQAILKFGGLGHTCAIYSRDDAKIREYGIRMPAFRVLVNTPTPQGSTGITTGVFPAMTLGCGAMAGNATSDNVSPLHLVNIKRVAYVIRTPAEAFEGSGEGGGASREAVVNAVERYLAQRGVAAPAGANRPATVSGTMSAAPTAAIVDRFLAGRRAPKAQEGVSSDCGCGAKPAAAAAGAPAAVETAAPPAPSIQAVDFVCEADVRDAIRDKRKIYLKARSIVTPSARELAAADNILVQAERA
ncbi:MAG: aldehyde dehydrogenase family protein [Bryobacteraceae bacterium]